MDSVIPVPSGEFVVEDGIDWFRIDDFDSIDPFLVNLVTPSDQWMFVSSSGALTAGRRSATHALFPYETDDRLHRNGGLVGPVTIIRIGSEVWEPFATHVPLGTVRRSILKTADGTRLRFEEHHPRLGLTFRYTWATADRFGFVRTSELVAEPGWETAEVHVLDGLRDVLPSGVDLATQQSASTLVDAYRRAELADPGVAVFTLEALVSDRPEPAESLRANTVWSLGLEAPIVALSDAQLRHFRSGLPVVAEHSVKGRKAGFFVVTSAVLEADSCLSWMMVAEVEVTHGQLAELRQWLRSAANPIGEVTADVRLARGRLVDIVARADGSQVTADRRATVHHFSNVLFNVMRGGVFLDDHRVRMGDVVAFIESRNTPAVERFSARASALPEILEIDELKRAVADDDDLSRLVAEFLPLTFSRRHGDPSRPWNAFEISVRSPSGDARIGYQGNWRDIFQNWEALLYSFPGYIESVIAKFLNASTVDGFNPYRITDRGIDWEIPEDGSWSNYGYWGDHQVAYLDRLIEASERFQPGLLAKQIGQATHSYADVPYRIVPYDRLVQDPKSTVVFDRSAQAAIDERVALIGADGRLVPSRHGGVRLASLAEKLVVPALSKLSNLVAGAGIWMNTQRPEWNDANNALVGNGVSAVTALYLANYIRNVDRLLTETDVHHVLISDAVLDWMEALHGIFHRHRATAASQSISPEARRALLDELGAAFSTYRERAYETGLGSARPVAIETIRGLCAAALPFLDQVSERSRRPDGTIESYWLMRLEDDRAEVEALGLMLEGQVAWLAGTGLEPGAAADLVDTLFRSPLYRSDQRSFLLYPDRDLPAFWEKNIVPDGAIGEERAASVLTRDVEGSLHFDASLRSRRDLVTLLQKLDFDPTTGAELLDLYERTFRHASFTGRSATMYRYEGLGSVYWHMVSKLLLAIQEHLHRAVESDRSQPAIAELVDAYVRVRAGLGYRKEVSEQGTFPTDPHSHTPAHTGAQQPGMTGQVKEGVLLRWGELGVRVVAGRLRFRPVVLSATEFLTETRTWDRLGEDATLEPGTLGFTFCGVPIVYHLSSGEDPWSAVTRADGSRLEGSEQLDRETSRQVFSRRGLVDRIDVGIPSVWLL
ncbi:MAG: hypothetical protein R3246_00065 [Acidimicrobiia bacterium]|nr:hypothetical protein [Acidimicrobiia bacterium]